MAGKISEGLLSHWLCISDLGGLSTYELNGLEREVSTPPTLCKELRRLYRLPFTDIINVDMNMHLHLLLLLKCQNNTNKWSK